MSPDSGEPPAPATDKAQQRPLSAIHGGLSSTELDELLVNTFNAMKDELISTLNLLLRSRDDAIDMAQEAFLRCWKAKEQLPRVANPRAWIFQVGMNAARDLRRSAWKRKSRPMLENVSFPARPETGFGSTLEEREELEAVRMAVAELREEEREVFLLRQSGEMTYEEIAITVGRPVGTVKTQMRSALQRVKAILAPHSPTEGPAEG
jgi:RNA polymerase sigma-70 factor (ECF subfamily)